MLRKLMLAALLPLGMVGVACEGEVTWEWGGEYNANFGGVADGAASDKKLLEINVEIVTEGADLDPDSIILNHAWSSTLSQSSTGDSTTIDYDQTATYNWVFLEQRGTTGTWDARFIATLQYGWNRFEVTGTATTEDNKGNAQTIDINIGPDYIFGDHGAPIPLKIQLEWDNPTAGSVDLDLVVYENPAASDKYIYYATPGYTQGCCLSAGCVPLSGGVNTDCYQGEGYSTFETREAAGYSFGSIDKDDLTRGGPEIYTLDAQPDGLTYTAGDTFDVYVNFYDDTNAPGSTVEGIFSVYLDGSATPRCVRASGLTEMKYTGSLTPAHQGDGTLVLIGTYTQGTGFAPAVPADEFTPTNGSCR